MKVELIPMDEVATATPEGKIMLAKAYEHNATNITVRLMPTNSGEDHNGMYMVMMLDWQHGMIIKMMFNAKEIESLSTAVNDLSSLTVLDGFDPEGATKH